jgi:hypothetical protein
MRPPRILLALLLLVSCDRPAPTATATAAAPAATETAAAAAPAPAAPAAFVPPEEEWTAGVAVDEPLPPFEDDGGIVVVLQSTWRARDAELPVSGDVIVYEAPDGSRLLRLENLRAPPGRRIDLTLSRSDGADQQAANATLATVGVLKGPSGNMNYLLDARPDFAGVRAVVLTDRETGRILAVAPAVAP